MQKLANFPVMMYVVVMGLGGFTLSYERLNAVFKVSDVAFEMMRILTTAVFAIIAIFYTLKAFEFKSEIKKELSHPIKVNFFAAFSISMFLLSAMWREFDVIFAVLFYPSLAFGTFFTFYVIKFWIDVKPSINQLNPTWFIPIVGNLIVVLASKENGEFLWYYFSLGLFFWVVLFVILFYKMVFCDGLVEKFTPTLFILIAPTAVAFLGYVKLTGSFDTFAKILLNLTIFFIGYILFTYKNFIKLKFFLSWWAFTFPTAATSMAFVKAYEMSGSKGYLYFGVGLFLALVVLVVIVASFTIRAIKNGELFRQE